MLVAFKFFSGVANALKSWFRNLCFRNHDLFHYNIETNKVEWKTNTLVTTDLSILLIEYSIKLQFWSAVDSNTCQKNGRNVFLQSFSKACLAKGKQRGHNSHIFTSLPLFQPLHLSPHFNRWHFKMLSDTFYHIFLCLTVAWKLVKWFQEH